MIYDRYTIGPLAAVKVVGTVIVAGIVPNVPAAIIPAQF